MTPEDVVAQLKAILGELEGFQLPMSPEAIRPEHRLVADLGIDSVALLDVAMALESRLGLAIDESELVELGTVGAIAHRLAGGR